MNIHRLTGSTTRPSAMADGTSPTDRLAVDRRQAARLLSLSERTIFSLTDAGELPVIRQGRAVRYPVSGLVAFVERRTEVLHGK